MLARLIIVLYLVLPNFLQAQETQKIIDVHLHINEYPLPYGFCALSGLLGTTDVDGKAICDNPLLPAADKFNLIEKSSQQMQQYNIVKAVVSSREFELVREWSQNSPVSTIPAIQLGELDIEEKYRQQTAMMSEEVATSDDSGSQTDLENLFDIPLLTKLIESGELLCLGEITTQYDGIAPNSKLLQPLYELAIKYDIPVGIHMAGFGAPRPGYVTRFGDPLLLEEILVKYPDLRIYVMHMGFPFVDEMAMIMRRYKNVYVDISAVSWMMPRTVYYQYLEKLINYGLGKRIMFGTDQVWWPEAIGVAVNGIREATFLSNAQKADIFYNNAERFFGLSE